MSRTRVLLLVVAGVCVVAFYAAPLARINVADVRCGTYPTTGTYSTALVPVPIPHWECRNSKGGVVDMGYWP